MGGCPVLVRLFKNGIHVSFARPSWFDCPVMLMKAHGLPGRELLNQIYYFKPDFKQITDALPAVDSFEMTEHRDEYYTPVKEDLLTWDEVLYQYQTKKDEK